MNSPKQPIELQPHIRAIVRECSARLNASESQVVSGAIELLSHLYRQARDAEFVMVFHDPKTRHTQDDELWVAAVPSGTTVRIETDMSQLDYFALRFGDGRVPPGPGPGPGPDDRPILRIVR